jgi:GNAT superfamily N-acetyltransferase
MTPTRVTEVIEQLADPERLASLSRAAKLTYRDWAQAHWQPLSSAAEGERWDRRLRDPIGWTAIAFDSAEPVGVVHFTTARTEFGKGQPIAGRAHLSGLFVLPTRWGEGIGSALLDAVVAEMSDRGYHSAQLFTATANRRSRRFYESRGWRASKVDSHEDDGLWLTRYARPLTA